MGNQIDVYVVNGDGDPVTGKEVKITVTSGFDLIGGEMIEYTDDDGHASFETYSDYDDSHEIYIRVGDYLEKWRMPSVTR